MFSVIKGLRDVFFLEISSLHTVLFDEESSLKNVFLMKIDVWRGAFLPRYGSNRSRSLIVLNYTLDITKSSKN
jgi:hypothetical protein